MTIQWLSELAMRLRLMAGTAFLLIFTVAVTSVHAPSVFGQDEPVVIGDGEQSEEEEEKPPPKLEEMEFPSVEQLMKGPPVDWIVLKKEERVIAVQPVTPRPGTLEHIEARMKKPAEHEPDDLRFDEEGNELDAAGLVRARRIWRQSLPYLSVYLPLDPNDRYNLAADDEYLLHERHIDRIIYFEDLMLQQIDRFLDKKQISEAYEMLVALRGRDPKWPGTPLREQRLLFEEAAVFLKKGQPEFALVNLELLHARAPGFTGLPNELGRVADQLMTTADQVGELRRVRHFLNRLKIQLPQHPIVLKWTETLSSRAAELVAAAETAEKAGQIEDALTKAETAAKTWPSTEGLSRVYNRLAMRYQRLRVGALLQPRDDVNVESWTAADARRMQLTQTRLFEPEQLDGEIVRYRSRFFTEWEPTGLGRRIRFQLRPHRQSWESQKVALAGTLINRFSELLNPAAADFDERFSANVSSVSLKSPFEFTLQLNAVPLRAEPLFTQTMNLPGAFQLAERDEKSVTYRRTIPEPEDAEEFHTAEIIEIKYDSHEKAVQGLMRGEVSLLPHVPLRHVDRLAEDQSLSMRKYQLPVTHVIQFNLHSRPLRNRALRRAMAYALNKQKLLVDHILGSKESEKGRLTSAPFPSKSYAFDSSVAPMNYDIGLAAAMVIAARKELGDKLPELKLLCAPDAFSRDLAKQMIDSWSRAGLTVHLISEADTAKTQNDSWDLVYRTVSMREPAVELWPFLTLQPTAKVSMLEHLPSWLRQELVELERAANWERTRELLYRLHRHLVAESHLIPLWEVDQYQVARKTIRGIPIEPMTAYDRVEQWTIGPWYSRTEP